MSAILQNWTNGFTDADTIPDHYHNGLPFEADGTLAITFTQAITHFSQGIPFSIEGRVNMSVFAQTFFGDGAAPYSNSQHLAVKGSGITVAYAHGIRYASDNKIILSVYLVTFLLALEPFDAETRKTQLNEFLDAIILAELNP